MYVIWNVESPNYASSLFNAGKDYVSNDYENIKRMPRPRFWLPHIKSCADKDEIPQLHSYFLPKIFAEKTKFRNLQIKDRVSF